MSLQTVLLALLSKEPNTGYGVGRLLRRDASHLWDARLQQIYAELAKLHANGLLDVQRIDLPNRPAKKVYTLTPEGERALDAWLERGPDPHACKDELLVWVYCLDRIPAEALVRQLERRREALERERAVLRERRARAARTDPRALGYLLTIEAALARAESHVAWCDRAIGLLSAGSDDIEAAPGDLERAASA
jgi:PadR family transcriptional regulator AphA